MAAHEGGRTNGAVPANHRVLPEIVSVNRQQKSRSASREAGWRNGANGWCLNAIPTRQPDQGESDRHDARSVVNCSRE